jgi:hypothetical protein
MSGTFKNHQALTVGTRVVPANKEYPPRFHGAIRSVRDAGTNHAKYEVIWEENRTWGFFFGFEIRAEEVGDAP